MRRVHFHLRYPIPEFSAKWDLSEFGSCELVFEINLKGSIEAYQGPPKKRVDVSRRAPAFFSPIWCHVLPRIALLYLLHHLISLQHFFK